jgi:hypothetical protein
MNENSATLDPKYLSHQEFVAAYKNNEIDFKIVGIPYDNFVFGSEKTILRVNYYLQYLPLLLIPLFAYLMNNWWLLFGILFYLITAGFAERNIVPFTGLFTLYCIVYWFVKGFSFYQNTTFFFFCALYIDTIISIGRNLQKKWAKQNVLYLKDLYHNLLLKDNIVITKK